MRKSLALAITCIAALAGPAQASAECANADALPTAENLEQIRAAIICLHNEARKEAGVAVLRSDARLATAADGHANDMVAQGYFSHDAPSGRGTFDRMRSTGYIRRGVVWNAGETIAWASGSKSTPRAVVDAWMGATTQRLTMLAPDFRHIGVGVALGAPVERAPDASPAVTFTVDYGWRTTLRALRTCLRRAAKRTGAARRLMRAKCHGLVARGAHVG